MFREIQRLYRHRVVTGTRFKKFVVGAKRVSGHKSVPTPVRSSYAYYRECRTDYFVSETTSLLSTTHSSKAENCPRFVWSSRPSFRVVTKTPFAGVLRLCVFVPAASLLFHTDNGHLSQSPKHTADNKVIIVRIITTTSPLVILLLYRTRVIS
jgi:hypothetical protein